MRRHWRGIRHRCRASLGAVARPRSRFTRVLAPMVGPDQSQARQRWQSSSRGGARRVALLTTIVSVVQSTFTLISMRRATFGTAGTLERQAGDGSNVAERMYVSLAG